MRFIKPLNSKKGFIDSIIGVIIGIVIAISVGLFMIAALWPEISDEIEGTRGEYTDSLNLSNTTAANLYGSNCFTGEISCINTSGGETVASGNYTWTLSTCSITGTDGGDYNTTNITCTYLYTTATTGNLSAIQTDIPAEFVGFIGILFVAITMMVILALWRMYKGNA